jgi:hypothetical protein
MSYLFSGDWEKSIEFHQAVEQLLDPGTHALISEHILKPRAGACLNCLVVGAGGGSTARWLAEGILPNGTVLATDIDTRFLSGSETKNLIVRKHNLAKDPPLSSRFDFIHARLLLNNLKDSEGCFGRLASWLRDDGILMVEDYDFHTRVTFPHSRSVELFNLAQIEHLKANGGDPAFGRKLLFLADANSLSVIHFGARIYAYRGGSAEVRGRKLSFERRREDLRDKGVISEDEANEIERRLDDPRFTWTSPALFTLIGQR